MAQNQSLQHKRSTTPGAQPNASQVAIGELAINFADKSIYTQDTSGNIIELARDLTKSATAPGSPSIGYLWYDTTDDILNIWDGAKWVNAANTGKSVLPGSTSAVPTFASGSGTLASPYVYSISTAAGTTVLTNVVTITGLTPNQFVPIIDLNASSNGGRFRVTNNIAGASGVLNFNIIFTDLPASTAGTNYTANFKIGNGTVYVNIIGAIASSFPQTVDFPTGVGAVSTLWTSAGDTLTTTGDLLISLDGVTFGAGPLVITTSDTLYTKWAGGPGTGIGIDSADGATITGSVLDSTSSPTSASLVIDKTPDPITFTPQTGVAQSTAIDSNTVTVSGFNSYAYITSSDTVSAAVDGGTFGAVPASGTSLYAVSGQTLTLRQTSSATSATTTTVTVAVGGGSADFTVTTIDAGIVTPSITSPTNGSTGISSTATLTSSAYAVTGLVGAHLNSDWQISTDSGFGTVVDSSLASTTNLTTWTPTGLLSLTQYWARVRYRSDDSTPVVSSWSATVTWITEVEVGADWTNRTSLSSTAWGTASVNALVWNGTQYVAGGAGGYIATSTDGISWTFRSSLSGTAWGPYQVRSMVWTGTKYVAVGGQSNLIPINTGGRVATSPDGVTWTNTTGLSSTAWTDDYVVYCIVWNGTTLVVGGYGGKIATSTNGTSWTYQSGLSSTAWGTDAVYALVWNGTQYVAGGYGGKIATSTNGTSWTYQSGLSSTAWGTATVNALVWNGTQYVAGGANGLIATSTDGVTWINRTSLSSTAWGTASVNALVWNGTQYVAGGSSGKIATSL